MTRPRYSQYELSMLEFLASSTDMGVTSESHLRESLRIPKASFSNVVANLVVKRLVETKRVLGVEKGIAKHQMRVALTQEGREFYEKRTQRYGQSRMPATVSKFLERRKPAVRRFFPIQEKFLKRDLLSSKDNVSIFGYPGSGKTLIGEMLMAKAISDGGRAVYLTPYKALDWQKYLDFKESFQRGIGAKVVVNDGDTHVASEDLLKSKIIIATYERAYGAWRSAEEWLRKATLVCSDEITLLADEERGGTIDLLLTGIKNHSPHTRMLTLSSLVGNPLELCNWLESTPVIENMPSPGVTISEYLVFKNGDGTDFLSRDGELTHVKTDLDPINYVVSQNLTRSQSTLIFVGPRFRARQLAKELKELHEEDNELKENASAFLRTQSDPTFLTKQVLDLVPHSLAFHHAGLLRETRRYIERLLREDKLMTIVATTTLSHGVDYAIDNVIIDSVGMRQAHRRDLEGYEYINLKGRAGRPGKSESASIYILTDKASAARMFNRYFTLGPEALYNTKVINKERIADLIVDAAITKSTLKEATNIIEATLTSRYSKPISPLVKEVSLELQEMGVIEFDRDSLVATETCRKLNSLNLSPYDLPPILKMPKESTDGAILQVASKIGLARNVSRRGLLRLEDPTISVLTSWMEEDDLDEIHVLLPSGYDDQDIVDLANETANSIVKMADFLPQMAPRLKRLAVRVRFGIKVDLIDSELLKIPYFRQRPARRLLRRMSVAGIKSIPGISSSDPLDLARRLGVSEEVAGELIASSKRVQI